MPTSEDRGIKSHFRFVVNSTSAPVNICPPASRLQVVFFNEGPANLRIGAPSGTVQAQGTFFPSGTYFDDEFSDDDWWAVTVGSGSGTVSGYLVAGL